MRVVALALCAASGASGLELRGAPAAAPAGPGGPGGPGRYNEAEYAADWHTEWAHGDFPNYKETYSNSKAVSQYTDRQSDGKASKAYGLVQTGAAPAGAPAGPGGPGGPGRYNEAEYAEDWHTEWAHGDFPNYKETYSNSKAVSQYTDRQSDGKASKAYGLIQTGAAPAGAPAGPGGPGGPGRYNEAEYAADWHTEWAHGDFPNYKETYSNSKAVSQYTDRQSDGKASKAYGLLQTGAAPAAAPAGPGGPGGPGRYNEAEYAADWHTEWAHGDFPNYKETYSNSKAVSQYTDRQSDGKASKAYGF